MAKFAVIDTETNQADQVMSIGTVIADADLFETLSSLIRIQDTNRKPRYGLIPAFRYNETRSF